MRATLLAIVGAVLVGVTLQQTDTPTESNTDEPTEAPPTPAPPTPAPPTPAPPTPAPPTAAPATDSPTDAPSESSTDSPTESDGAGVVEISITITGMTMAELNADEDFKTSYIGAIRSMVASTASVDADAVSVTLEEGSVVAIVVFQHPAAAQTSAMINSNGAALQTGIATNLNALPNKPEGVSFEATAIGTRTETRTPTTSPTAAPPTATPTAAPPTATPAPTNSTPSTPTPTSAPGAPEESGAASLHWSSMVANVVAAPCFALLFTTM